MIVKCLECGCDLEIMYEELLKIKISSGNVEERYHELIGHCKNCLRDWKWYESENGTTTDLERVFWG